MLDGCCNCLVSFVLCGRFGALGEGLLLCAEAARTIAATDSTESQAQDRDLACGTKTYDLDGSPNG